MKKNAAPISTSTHSNAVRQANNANDSYKREFLAAVISMSWQLAIVVLLPVLGGYSLDNHFRTLPLWTIIGFVVAVVGVITILRRMLKLVGGEDKS